MKAAVALPPVLLIEPQFVMRRTMVAVAREMGLAEFHEATCVARALPVLATRAFRGLVLDMSEGPEAITLLERLRAGNFASLADTPVIALTFSATEEIGSKLEELQPLHTLHKPFKVRELLESVSRLRRR